MEETKSLKIHASNKETEEEWRNLYQHLFKTLPTQTFWNGHLIHLYDGIWYPRNHLKGLLYLKEYFKPQKNDIILASFPKSGTNWLKTLAFTIVNRSRYSLNDTPLLTCNIRQLVPFLDGAAVRNDHFPDFDMLNQPRVFATHASYDTLPSSIKDSENKIVYICRNPMDQFISLWHFAKEFPNCPAEFIDLEKAFEEYCQGNHAHGPFWDHILGYWRVKTERPDKLLILKYEDLKKNNVVSIKKLAAFLGFPFSEEEETQGLIQEISNFCGFESMKALEVNNIGKTVGGIPHTVFLRKGQVGDFRNYLSPDQIEKMEKLIQEKYSPFGLSFDIS